MSDLTHERKTSNEYKIKLAEENLVKVLDEAVNCKDSDCADYKVFSKQLRERIAKISFSSYI